VSVFSRLSFFAQNPKLKWPWVAFLCLFVFPAVAQLPPKEDELAVKFEIHASPIESFDLRDPQRREFGPLVFRGGIELSSHQSGFGGLREFPMPKWHRCWPRTASRLL
jgi:hypothetical protein